MATTKRARIRGSVSGSTFLYSLDIFKYYILLYSIIHDIYWSTALQGQHFNTSHTALVTNIQTEQPQKGILHVVLLLLLLQ